MKIIVNADDLGMSRQVNDAIFAHMAAGRVTSATLLANGEAFEDAIERARAFPRCSFGVHLNASQWRPITNDVGLRPILNADGCFAGNRLREVRIDGSLRTALLNEWSAQIERVQSASVHVSHIDSHHHMHTVPGVFMVLKRLQRRYGLRKVRQTMNIYPPDLPAPPLLLARKFIWNVALQKYIPTRTTEGFTSLACFHNNGERLAGKFTVVELMVHPGNDGYVDETRLLTGEWWRYLGFPTEFISYNEL